MDDLSRRRRPSDLSTRSGAGGTPNGPAQGPPDHVDDLLDVPVGVAVLRGRPHAALDVILEDEHRERIDRRSQRAGLLEDVHAVLLALDHSADAPDLALDAREPSHELGLVPRVAVPEVIAVVAVDRGRSRGIGWCHPADDTPGGYRGQDDRPRAATGRTGYTRLRMDPLDHRLALPDGLRCTVCDERVPAERLRLLAWRDELVFLQIECSGCLSTTLGFVVAGATDDEAAGPEPPPITSDDVLDMHQFLATWRGDLSVLLGSDRGRPEPSR